MSGFDAQVLTERLRRSGALLLDALREVDPEEVALRPAPSRWSCLEIAVHLVDEEREDFRARLRSTLEDPARAWSPIDPEAWVRDRCYAQRDFAATLADFAEERAASVAWLGTIAGGDWDRAHVHPSIGVLRAGDLLASWAAHDLLHLAQLARTRAQLLGEAVAPYSARYAMP